MTVAPIPRNVPVIELDPRTGEPLPGYGMGKDFGNWFQSSVVAPVANAPQLLPAVDLKNQSTSLSTTPMPLPALATGAYRISYYTRKTTADGVSSSLTITFSWTESAQALTVSGSTLTTDATTAVQSGSLVILRDASSPISYSTTYVSNTPGLMRYRLFILVETV